MIDDIPEPSADEIRHVSEIQERALERIVAEIVDPFASADQYPREDEPA